MRTLKPSERDLLFSGTGPLSSFSSKIRVAYALNLIGPETRSDLDRLRELRNAGAHAQVPVTFEMPEIRNVIMEFKWLSRVSNAGGKSPRELFLAMIRILMTHLIVQLPGSCDIEVADELREIW